MSVDKSKNKLFAVVLPDRDSSPVDKQKAARTLKSDARRDLPYPSNSAIAITVECVGKASQINNQH
jgi:hypothetical protein